MSHAWRTTLFLGLFWGLIILGAMYQLHFRMSKQEKALIEQEKQVLEELELDETLIAGIATISDELEAVTQLWTNRHKAIPNQETPHETYQYLDQILRRRWTTLNFDFTTVAERDSSGIHLSEYRMDGEARFLDLYRFIWHIEHLPRYIRINSLEMEETLQDQENTTPEKRWVKFVLSLTAFSADRPGFETVAFVADLTPPGSTYDPFKPPYRPKQKIPPNTRGLPNVFKANLRALTPTQAYITDQNGELKILNLGDEVYLGYLVDINPDEKTVLFDLNKLIPPRKVPLKIDANN
ncbi:hypothetical protein CEE37_10690 [candidate division LCP-89 bacterium B3_LCP]|uniref:Uncharacterized protein n=1 Tax=candidate division LCP-89 bacterium B3_LCP TaxID=2012998 RepID=A0A532UXR0_UNCL8|nr:MAG: hypothetical protein CEE37_10690 [candidate division LCP-89 bacterium B3_LCP]